MLRNRGDPGLFPLDREGLFELVGFRDLNRELFLLVDPVLVAVDGDVLRAAADSDGEHPRGVGDDGQFPRVPLDLDEAVRDRLTVLVEDRALQFGAGYFPAGLGIVVADWAGLRGPAGGGRGDGGGAAEQAERRQQPRDDVPGVQVLASFRFSGRWGDVPVVPERWRRARRGAVFSTLSADED